MNSTRLEEIKALRAAAPGEFVSIFKNYIHARVEHEDDNPSDIEVGIIHDADYRRLLVQAPAIIDELLGYVVEQRQRAERAEHAEQEGREAYEELRERLRQMFPDLSWPLDEVAEKYPVLEARRQARQPRIDPEVPASH